MHELNQILNKVTADGKLEAVDIEQAEDAVLDASADVKEYTAMILIQIYNLKGLVHAELTVNRRPEERQVQEALDNMFDVEHGERSGIINKLKRKLDTIKSRQQAKLGYRLAQSICFDYLWF